MPFWKDLTATRQLLSDSASLTVNKIAADTDIARIHNDAQAWSVNHLAKRDLGRRPDAGDRGPGGGLLGAARMRGW